MTRGCRIAAFALALSGIVMACGPSDAEGADDEPRLGDVMKTPALIDTVERLASRACACETAECRQVAQAALDKVVARHAQVKLSAADNKRVRAAAQALVECDGTSAGDPEHSEEGGQSASVGGDELEGPSEGDRALADLMRAVKARCRCDRGDQACTKPASEALDAAIAAADSVRFKTAQEATRRSLIFEAQECRAPLLAEGGTKAKSPTTRGAVPIGAATPVAVAGPAGKVATWSQLPRSVNGIKHLLRVGAAQRSEAIADLWSMTVAEVLERFPKARKQEVDDLEPEVVRLRMPLAEVDGRGRPLIMEWAFDAGRLFMVTVELKRSAPKLVDQVQTFMGRPPDARTDERWRMKVATWRDGPLLLRATIDGRSNDFALADAKRHAAYTAARAKVRPAYLANRRGLSWLLGRPLRPMYRKAEGALLKAITLFPSYGHAHVNLCRLYMLRGQTRAAGGRCKSARDSRNASALGESALYMGKLALLAGNSANAKKWFRLVASYDPEDSSLVPVAARHLRVMAGKGSKRDLERVMRRIHCAEVEGDTTRADVYARSYGFASVLAAGKAAGAKGVELAESKAKANKRCGSP